MHKPAPAEPKKWTVGRVVAWTVGIVLMGAGLLWVGMMIFLFFAIQSWGSSK